MSGFLSDAQNQQVQAGLLKLHETLLRKITVLQLAEEIFLESDDNYSIAYNYTRAKKNIEPVKSEVGARIYYSNTDYEDTNILSPSLGFVVPAGKIMIRVTSDGYELLKSAKEVYLDGKRANIESASKPVGNGVFNNLFWDFYLTPFTEEP